MAWGALPAPRAWASGELVTSGNMNSYISDLLNYLKGALGTVAIDSAMTIQGGTAWHSGNDGVGSGLDADLLDGLQSSLVPTGNTIPQRDGSGNLQVTYINMVADDQGATLPSRVAGRAAGDNWVRWYNSTNWVRGNYDSGNGSGNVPVSNGTVNTNLNAQLFDGRRVHSQVGGTSYILPNLSVPYIVFARATGGQSLTIQPTGGGAAHLYVATTDYPAGYAMTDGHGIVLLGVVGSGWYAVGQS